MKDWKKLLPVFAVLLLGWIGLNLFTTDNELELVSIPRVPVPFEGSETMRRTDYIDNLTREWKEHKEKLERGIREGEEKRKEEETATAIAEKVVEILVKGRYADLPEDLSSELADQDLRIDKLIKSYADKQEKNKVTIGMVPLTGIPSPDGRRVFNKGESLDFEWDPVHELYKVTIRTNVNGVDITEFGAFAPTHPWSVIYKEREVAVSTACMNESTLDPFETIYQRQYDRLLKCEEIVPPDLSEQ